MKTAYRIMKLRSGETVICKITNSSKSTVTLDRPMELHFPQFVDVRGNTKKGPPCMKNWLAGTDEISIIIPNDYVAVFLPPTKEMIHLYEEHKQREDTVFETPTEDELSLLEMLTGMKPSSEEESEESEEKEPSVGIKIEIPPVIWMSMLAHGLLGGVEDEWKPPDDRDDFFGNHYEDWSPNPNDN